MSITAGVLSERGTAYSLRTHGFMRKCLLFTNTWVHEELLTLHEHMGSRGTAYSSRTHGFTRKCLLFTNTWVHEELLTLHEHMGSRGTAYSSRTHGFTPRFILWDLCCSSFLSCAKYCLCLWIVHSQLSNRFPIKF
jgi:hypothetical protein